MESNGKKLYIEERLDYWNYHQSTIVMPVIWGSNPLPCTNLVIKLYKADKYSLFDYNDL
jgi:hypothetical protein